MTLQQLTYFLAAVEHGSFSAAAESLFMAQPSLSEQIRRLEAELGVPLFARVGRGLELTEAGPPAPAARRAHAWRRRARPPSRSRRCATSPAARSRSARSAARTTTCSAAWSRTSARSHPNVRVRAIGQNSAEVADAVREGRLEAGLVVLPVDDRGLDVRPAMREELLYVSADPERVRRADDDRAARRRAADPLRRALGRRRPDAPPAARARAAGRRDGRAADRGRVRDRRARACRPRARRHRQLAAR